MLLNSFQQYKQIGDFCSNHSLCEKVFAVHSKAYIYRCLIVFLLCINTLSGQTNSTNKKESQIVFLEEEDSFENLLSKFKGSIVYIDFWGSWCKSCLNEFAENPTLDSVFEVHNVKRLYIAIEKQSKNATELAENRKIWETHVNRFNLAGYNYYCELKTPFFTELIETVMGNKISLPRFAILDKSGNFTNKKAAAPSNTEKVIKQIKKQVLKNN